MKQHPILKLLEKKERLVIGFMSGTSADGVDAVLARIGGCGTDIRVKQLAFVYMPFPAKIRAQILHLASGAAATAADFCRINFLLGELYAEAGEQLCAEAGISVSDVDLIGNHGQTLWHIPVPEDCCGYRLRSTLQLGGDAVLAERFGCPVVGDFRVRDMAAGGQGAPLVPYTEFLLYRSGSEHTALQNIGGIGNITFLPAGCALSDVRGFDTGPGNMIMDAIAAKLTDGRLTYDEGGALAASGTVRENLLAEMMRDEFITRKPPKTTGREYYGPAYMERLYALADSANISLTDLLATATRFTAESIAYAIRCFAPVMPDRLIVGGGGSMNPTLMAAIRSLLPACRVMVNEDLGLDSNAKEALAFAILANETICAECNNAPGATGAAHPVVMGRISL